MCGASSGPKTSVRFADRPSSIGTGRRGLGYVEVGCQDRGRLVGHVPLIDISIWGRCCLSKARCIESLAGVNRYDRQRLTRKSVPEPDWMAGTIGSTEYEFAPLQGYRLGFIAGFDRETGHHPGCRLRRRQNPDQAGCNSPLKASGIDHSTESVAMAMRTNQQWIDMAGVEVREASVSGSKAPVS
jgi:hypothetical protein